MGQIDARNGHTIFDVFVEGQGLSFFRWANGVYGLMATQGRPRGAPPVDEVVRGVQVANRLIGTEGEIELWAQDVAALRWHGIQTGGAWRAVEVGERDAYVETTVANVVDLADALKTGREPECSGRKALQATEIIFATYESSRRRGRVDLPLDIEDSPLQSMLDSGEITA
jgi:predicted dehydrogenase